MLCIQKRCPHGQIFNSDSDSWPCEEESYEPIELQFWDENAKNPVENFTKNANYLVVAPTSGLFGMGSLFTDFPGSTKLLANGALTVKKAKT